MELKIDLSYAPSREACLTGAAARSSSLPPFPVPRLTRAAKREHESYSQSGFRLAVFVCPAKLANPVTRSQAPAQRNPRGSASTPCVSFRSHIAVPTTDLTGQIVLVE